MIRCTNNNPISYDSRYLLKESVRIYQCLISIRWYKDPGIGILVQHLNRSLLFPLTSSINKFLLSERSIYLSLSNKISRLFKNPKESHGIIIFVKFDENDSSPLLITSSEDQSNSKTSLARERRIEHKEKGAKSQACE